MTKKAIDIQKILSIFKEISLPCGSDNKIGEKEKKIISLLRDKYPNLKFNPQTGILIPAKQKQHKIVITSHYDLISLFQKAFKDGKREPFVLKENGIIKGALDNTLTNSVLIYLLLNYTIPENVEILFTNMEEIGCIGMRNYLKELEKKNYDKEKDIFFINLDVTNECWEHQVSLEMDYPIYELIHFLKKEIKGMTEEREGDDLCEVIDFNYKGFSFCIPTKKTIHSWKNKTTIKHIEKYTEKLLFLILNSTQILELSKNKSFSYVSIKTVLEKTKEEIEKIKKQSQLYPKIYSGYDYDYSLENDYYEELLIELEDFVIIVTDELHDKFEKYQDLECFEIIGQNIVDKIYDYLYFQEPFTYEEILGDVENSKKAKKIANEMLEYLYVQNYLIKETLNDFEETKDKKSFFTPNFNF